jgi:hypothetical protein
MLQISACLQAGLAAHREITARRRSPLVNRTRARPPDLASKGNRRFARVRWCSALCNIWANKLAPGRAAGGVGSAPLSLSVQKQGCLKLFRRSRRIAAIRWHPMRLCCACRRYDVGGRGNLARAGWPGCSGATWNWTASRLGRDDLASAT